MTGPDRNWKLVTPRFSLRFLLALVTLLSVWLGSHVKRARDQQMAVESLRQAGVNVQYSFQIPPYGLTEAQEAEWSSRPFPPNSSWLQSLVGEKFFLKVSFVGFHDSNIAAMPRDLLENLTKTPEIRHLHLTSSRITNADLKHLKGLRNLEGLYLDCPSVTDEGLRYISGLANLQSLTLRSQGVTDAGLRHLSGLTNLQYLSLESDEISGEGLHYLWNLRKLSSFEERKTRIQNDALRELWRRLPQLEAEF